MSLNWLCKKLMITFEVEKIFSAKFKGNTTLEEGANFIWKLARKEGRDDFQALLESP